MDPMPYASSRRTFTDSTEPRMPSSYESYGAKLRRLAKSPHYYEVMQEQGWGDYDDQGRFRIRRNPDDARLEALINARDQRIASENKIKEQQSSPEYLLAQAASERMRREAEGFETPAQRSERELSTARRKAEMELELLPKRKAAERPVVGTPEYEQQNLIMDRIATEKRKGARERLLIDKGMNSEFEGMDPEDIRGDMQSRSAAARSFKRAGNIMTPDELREAFKAGGITADQYRQALRDWFAKNETLGPVAVERFKAEKAKDSDWIPFNSPNQDAITESLEGVVGNIQRQYNVDKTEALTMLPTILPANMRRDPLVTEALRRLSGAM